MEFLEILTRLSSNGVSMTFEYDEVFSIYNIKLKKGSAKGEVIAHRENLIYGGKTVQIAFEKDLVDQIDLVAAKFAKQREEWREKYAPND